VVADHPFADTDPLGDASEGRLPEADLGDRVDRGGNDLLAPSVLDERPLISCARRCRSLTAWSNFSTMGQFRAIMRERAVSNNERVRATQHRRRVESDWNLEDLANGPLDHV
jgi:hypothetical protein